MIGVRKDSGVIRLLMAAALVLFVAACSTSDSGLKNERDQALEQVEELEGTVVDLTGTVDELRGQLEELMGSGSEPDQEKIKMLEDRIAALEKDLADAEAAKNRASVLLLYKGLNPQINPTTAGGAEQSVLDEASLTRFDVVHGTDTDANNMALRVTSGKATKVTPPAEGTGPMNNKLADAAGMLSDAQGDWSMTVVSAQDSGTKNTDTVVVVTDIAPDKELEFAGLFLKPGEDGQPGDLNGPANNVRTVQDGDAGHIASDAFPTTAGITVHDPDPNDDAEVVRIGGTFAGASGEYRCTENAEGSCTSQGTNKGVQLNNGATGTWFFDPDEGAMALKADPDYSYFGWWWRVASAKNGGGYDLDVFHGNMDGRAVVQDEAFEDLTGSATYVGPAVGKFAISPQLPDTQVMGGHWNATATLMVDFEEDSPASGDNPAYFAEISGSIHDFMQDGNELPFDVALPKTGVPAAADETAAFDSGGVVWSIDGEKSTSKGTWSGNFWNQGKVDEVPSAVTGEFAATYNAEVGRIEGAFGANKQ